jgi:predicted nuclease of restriction endonuclease-like (RecB) superfamily
MSLQIDTEKDLYLNITKLISQTKQNIAISINSTLSILYWHIGKEISNKILKNNRADYGKNILKNLSIKLSNNYGKGYTKRNLDNMVKFYKIFNNYEIVHSLSTQLTWTHFKTIIYIDDKLKRDFYIGMIKLDRWSTRTLKDRIDSQLYERVALSKKSDSLIKHEIDKLNSGDISPNIILKDPYILDFLELNDRYLEKDLEDAILREIESFILELGSGFSFIARQKIIQIDNIGIILCADKQSEQIELLELDKSNIHVAQYLTVLPDKKLLEEKLHKAIENAKKIYNKGTEL